MVYTGENVNKALEEGHSSGSNISVPPVIEGATHNIIGGVAFFGFDLYGHNDHQYPTVAMPISGFYESGGMNVFAMQGERATIATETSSGTIEEALGAGVLMDTPVSAAMTDTTATSVHHHLMTPANDTTMAFDGCSVDGQPVVLESGTSDNGTKHIEQLSGDVGEGSGEMMHHPGNAIAVNEGNAISTNDWQKVQSGEESRIVSGNMNIHEDADDSVIILDNHEDVTEIDIQSMTLAEIAELRERALDSFMRAVRRQQEIKNRRGNSDVLDDQVQQRNAEIRITKEVNLKGEYLFKLIGKPWKGDVVPQEIDRKPQLLANNVSDDLVILDDPEELVLDGVEDMRKMSTAELQKKQDRACELIGIYLERQRLIKERMETCEFEEKIQQTNAECRLMEKLAKQADILHELNKVMRRREDMEDAEPVGKRNKLH